jgi:hypothetical protein
MFQALRKRIQVSPATVIASLALVFAMTGGAYAAGRYVITSTKQISPKVLKSLTGKAGPAGAAGANGAAGPAGPTGPAGGTGPAGTNGTNGESIKGETGKEGPQGKEGNIGKTLAPGETETGTWVLVGEGNAAIGSTGGESKVAISFPIPLAAPIEDVRPLSNPKHLHTLFVESGEGPAEQCEKGTFEDPKAAPGNLCVYVREPREDYDAPEPISETADPFSNPEKDPERETFYGAGKSGTIIQFSAGTSNETKDEGVWAVTEKG